MMMGVTNVILMQGILWAHGEKHVEGINTTPYLRDYNGG